MCTVPSLHMQHHATRAAFPTTPRPPALAIMEDGCGIRRRRRRANDPVPVPDCERRRGVVSFCPAHRTPRLLAAGHALTSPHLIMFRAALLVASLASSHWAGGSPANVELALQHGTPTIPGPGDPHVMVLVSSGCSTSSWVWRMLRKMIQEHHAADPASLTVYVCMMW